MYRFYKKCLGCLIVNINEIIVEKKGGIVLVLGLRFMNCDCFNFNILYFNDIEKVMICVVCV